MPNASCTQVQKAIYIVDDAGRQGRARQTMLPKAWKYEVQPAAPVLSS